MLLLAASLTSVSRTVLRCSGSRGPIAPSAAATDCWTSVLLPAASLTSVSRTVLRCSGSLGLIAPSAAATDGWT